jgi:hypothetical protein
MKDKKIKDKRERRNIYIKVMYTHWETLLVLYILGNTIVIQGYLLNLEKLMWVNFYDFI